MKPFSIGLAVLFLIDLFQIGASLAAESPGLTRTQSRAGVTVRVTYVNPPGNGDAHFVVVLDAGMVDLAPYDLKVLSSVRDDTGKSYLPKAIVESKGGSHHHREFLLSCPKPTSKTKWLELVIKDIAGVKERAFRWDVE